MHRQAHIESGLDAETYNNCCFPASDQSEKCVSLRTLNV